MERRSTNSSEQTDDSPNEGLKKKEFQKNISPILKYRWDYLYFVKQNVNYRKWGVGVKWVQ
jgi:hypothetical protein